MFRRIAFIGPLGEIGGAERSLLAWMEAVREVCPKASVRLLVLGNGPLITAARELGVTVEVMPMPHALAVLGDSGLRGLRGARAMGSLATLAGRAVWAAPAAACYVRQVRAKLRRWNPDVVHSTGIKTHLLTWMAGLNGNERGPAVVWHVHDFIGDRPLMAKALRWAADGVGGIAVSEAVAADAREALPGVRVVTAYNVVDTDRFTPEPSGDGADLDELAGLATAPAATLRVVLVATYARWKGQDTFLSAAAKLPRQAGEPGREVRFYIVGGPIYRTVGSQFSLEEMRERAAALGIGDRVGFIPFQSDPAAIYRSADVMVHASNRPEPFGLTIVEAMACGKPTIVSAAGGAAELFTEGHDALGFPPGDADALAAAVRRLLSDRDLRHLLGRNARQTAVRRFDRRGLGTRVLELYGQLLVGD